MSTKLSDSNPYLRDPTLRQRSVRVSVATSSAIEGIRAPFKKETSAAKPVAKKADGIHKVAAAATVKSR